MNGSNMKKPPTRSFTRQQVQMGLAVIAHVQLSRERFRQFREGGVERRRRKSGLYERPYEGILQPGRDWKHENGVVVYSEEAVRAIFKRYGVRLREADIQRIASFPRDARRRRATITRTRDKADG